METNNYYGSVTIIEQPAFTIEIIGCYLPLTNSEKFAIVDLKYLKHLSQFKWSYTEGYVIRTTGKISLHRYIMQLEGKLNEGDEVDHRDTDPLNNIVSNLRMCNRLENCRNRVKRVGCTSKYIGVSWHSERNKWQCHIKHDGKNKNLGSFTNEIEAAMAYDRALRTLPVREEFKRYNFNVL